MLPVAANVPAVGSYSSELTSPPPAISTFPLHNTVAECAHLATVMVPVGKRLHIEYVWMGGWASDGQVLRVGLTCIVNRVIGNFGFHTMPVVTTPQFRSDGDASFPVSLYADAGTDVTVWGNRTGGYSGQAFVEAILSGHLLPA